MLQNRKEEMQKEIPLKEIPFSPPDISQMEIEEVVEVLRSGWITTGSKTKKFEKELANYCHTGKVVCLNSATAAEELNFRILGIGEGDEVIVPAYTYCFRICGDSCRSKTDFYRFAARFNRNGL